MRSTYPILKNVVAKFDPTTKAQQTAASGVAARGLKELRSTRSNPGALRGYLFVPGKLACDSPALVVALHGCGQTAAQYDHGSGWSVLAERHGFVVLYPEQQGNNNANGCFNWFERSDIVRGSGEAHSIHELIEDTIAAHGIDRSKVFITGLSAGGAMASVMLATYPEMFAGGSIIAGLPYGVATSVQDAFQTMFNDRGFAPHVLGDNVRDATDDHGSWPRITVWHGTADRVVVPGNAEHIIAQWLNVHGLENVTAVETAIGGNVRRIWNAEDGSVLVDAVMIDGMGHGVPLAPSRGHDACGNAGPYFLDVGICSTRHAAMSWGLTETIVKPDARPAPSPRTESVPRLSPGRTPKPKPATPEASPAAAEVPAGSPAAIIEAALKSAGLDTTQGNSDIAKSVRAVIDKALAAAGLKRG